MRATFSFELLPKSERDLDGRRMSKMRVGSDVESSTVWPLPGSVETVEKVWLKRLRELVTIGKPVGLPTASNMTWIFYRTGTKIRIHEMLMLYPYCPPGGRRPMGPRLTRTCLVTHIPPYRSKTDDGYRISEWITTVAAIKCFLNEKSTRNRNELAIQNRPKASLSR